MDLKKFLNSKKTELEEKGFKITIPIIKQKKKKKNFEKEVVDTIQKFKEKYK